MGRGLLLGAVVLAVGVIFWRPLRRVRSVLGVDYLVSTGHAFLVLGYLLGLTVGEQSRPVAGDLRPVMGFVAGWVGFATGMRFDVRVLRAVPARAFGVALYPGIIAAVVVGALTLATLAAADAPVFQAMAASMVVAAASASSGPTLAAIVRGRRAGRNYQARSTLRMIEFSAGIDDLLVLALAAVAFAYFQPQPSVGALWLLGATVGGGATLGVLTWLFMGGGAADEERLLLGLAMLAFIAGFGGWLYLSPAAVAAIAAMVLVNLPGDRGEQLLRAVRRVERPAVVVLMTVIGFHVTGPVSWLVVPLVAIMTLVRLASKHLAGRAVAGAIAGAPGLAASRHWGSGLAPQGILGLIIALTFFHVWDGVEARTVLMAVALSSIINELLAPWLMVWLLGRLDEPGALPVAPRRRGGA